MNQNKLPTWLDNFAHFTREQKAQADQLYRAGYTEEKAVQLVEKHYTIQSGYSENFIG